MRRVIIWIFLMGFGLLLNAQTTWSLQRCIDRAYANSLSIQSSRLAEEQQAISLKSAKAARLPNLNGSAGFFEQFGRTIDPTTNVFANQKIGSARFGLNAGVILFNAGRINHTIRQAKINMQAARLQSQSITNDLGLNVAMIYLQILFAEDQVQSAKDRLQIAQSNLDRAKALIRAGSLAANEALNLEAQVATAEQGLLSAQSTLDRAYLLLKQILLLDEDEAIKIERPDIDADRLALSIAGVEESFQKALTTQPQIEAANLRIQSSLLGEKIAKTARYPSLSLSGSLSTNYSSLSKKIEGFETVTIPQPVTINGNPAVLGVAQSLPVLKDNPFTNQLNENFGQAFGFQLNIPLYQNNRINAAVQRAHIATLQARIEAQQAKQKLKTDIQKAVSDALAAKKQLDAAKKSLAANEAVYQNTLKKFDAGSAGAFELTTAKANRDLAETRWISARYDFVFKVKVVDYYLGKPLKL